MEGQGQGQCGGWEGCGACCGGIGAYKDEGAALMW